MTREDVINELRKLEYYGRPFDNSKEQGEKAISKAQALAVAIQILEQEPCDDCISRQAALDTFGLSEKSRKYGGDHSGYDTIMLYEVQDALEALPHVTPQLKMGHWITNSNYPDKVICDLCESKYDVWFADKGFKYCPNCGAKMEEEK